MMINGWKVEDLGYNVQNYDANGVYFPARVFLLTQDDATKLSYAIIDKNLLDMIEDPESFCMHELEYRTIELNRE